MTSAFENNASSELATSFLHNYVLLQKSVKAKKCKEEYRKKQSQSE